MDRRSHLRGLLLFHPPADAAERAHKRAILDLLDLPGDVFDRRHVDPGHLTASAFVISDDGRDLLLIHHARLGRWLQPGGHVEADDVDLVAAARREVREEVGLWDVECDGRIFDVDVHEIPARKGEPAHLHHDVRFLIVARTREVIVGDGVTDVRWVPLGEVGSLGGDASVMRAVARLMG